MAPAVAAATRIFAVVEVETAADAAGRALAALGYDGEIVLLGCMLRSDDPGHETALIQIATRFLAGGRVSWPTPVPNPATLYLSFADADHSFAGGPLWHTLAEEFDGVLRVAGGSLVYGGEQETLKAVAGARIVVALFSPQSIAILSEGRLALTPS